MVIVLLLSASAAIAQVEGEEQLLPSSKTTLSAGQAREPIKSAERPKPPETREPIVSAARPSEKAPPTEKEPNWHVYKDPKNPKIWELQPTLLKEAPEGLRYEGGVTLTDANIEFARDKIGSELVSVENNKIALQGKEQPAPDVSIGDKTITSWTGRVEDVSYDEKTKQILYKGDVISAVPDQPGMYSYAEKPTDYVQNTPGGLLIKRGDEVSIAGQRFKQGEWEAMTVGIDAQNYAVAAYTFSDLGFEMIPEEKGEPAGTFKISDREVTIKDGQAISKEINKDGSYTEETYTYEKGRKVVSSSQEVDAGGKTTSKHTFGDKLTVLEDNVVITIGTQAAYTDAGGKERIFVQLEGVRLQQGYAVGLDTKTRRLVYTENGKELTGDALDKFEKELDKPENEAQKKAIEAQKEKVEEALAVKTVSEFPERERDIFFDVRTTLQNFVRAYEVAAGYAVWSSLIWDDETLQKWRDKINHIMCEKTGGLLGGKECWTSKICGRHADITPPRSGVLFNAPVGGAPRPVAHIEGQRSLPIVSHNETRWIYTITFGLANPQKEKDMNYNVRFVGPRRTANWWSEGQLLKAGGSASAVGGGALIKLSSNEYTEVCLEFNPSITSFGGKRVGSVCNSIVQATPEVTAPYGPGINVTAAAQPSAAAPGAPAPPGANV